MEENDKKPKKVKVDEDDHTPTSEEMASAGDDSLFMTGFKDGNYRLVDFVLVWEDDAKECSVDKVKRAIFLRNLEKGRY